MTPQIIITAVILAVVVYMFFSPRFPNAVVATVGAIAVSLTGTVAFKEVFTNYASTSIVLMIGMMVVGGGMFHTGFAGWLGNKIVSKTGTGTKSIQVVAILAFIMESGHYTPKDVFKWGLVECLAMILAVVIFIPVFWMR